MKQDTFSPVGKHVLHTALAAAILQLCLPAVINAQGAPQPPAGLRIVASSSAPQANAAAFSAAGNGTLYAQASTPAPPLQFRSPDSPEQPTAMTLSVVGKCEYSEDGATFTNLA
jgi:hypothetical protein